METTEKKGKSAISGMVVGLAGAVGIFATMAVITSLSSADYQLADMLKNYLVATGNMGEYNTLVDFYTHIKGVEYLMAGAFFVAFPVFFKYINKNSSKANV